MYARRSERGYLSGFNAPTFTGTPTFSNGMTVSSGQIIMQNAGTASLPSIAWEVSGSANYGLFQSSISIGLSTAGAERANWNAGGQTLAAGLFMTGSAQIQLPQVTAPAAPAAGFTRIYAVDNGAGKTQLRARFDTGAEQAVATEP